MDLKNIFDAPAGSTTQIPTGNWVLDVGNTGGGVIIEGKITELSTSPVIEILDGTTLEGLNGIERLTLRNLSNNPVIELTNSGLVVFRIGNAAEIISLGAAPLINCIAGVQLVAFMANGAVISTGTIESINLENGSFCQIISEISSGPENNTISGAVGSTLVQRSQSSSAYTNTSNQFPTHANFLGTLQNFIDSSSFQLDYTENNLPTLQNLSGVVPTSNQEAINEIKTGRTRKRINVVNGPVTLDESYEIILVDANAAPFDITLPLIASSSEPNYAKHFLIARLDTTVNAVNILPQGLDQYQLIGNAPAASAALPSGSFLNLYAESTTGVWFDIT